MRPALLVLLLVSVVTAAHAQTWAAIEKQYARFSKAYVKNDVKTMLAILSPEYTITDENGKTLDYKKYKAQLQERKDRGQVSSAYTVKIISLEVKDKVATVGTEEITKGIGGVEHVHNYRDIWKKEKGVWRLASTTTLGHR